MMDQTDPRPPLTLTDEPDLLHRGVLLVLNDPSAQFAIAAPLHDAGAEVCFATDIPGSVFRCEARQESGKPFDLVIVSLRHAWGLEACRALRASGYRGPLLALGDAHAQPAAEHAGADAVAADHDALHHAAVELVRRAEAADERPSGAFDAQDPPPVISDLAAFPQMHVMLERFVEQLPQRISAMVDAAAERDLQLLERLIGELKRSAGSHGYVDICREAGETEKYLRATGQWHDALEPLSRLCLRAVAAADHDLPLPPSA